MWLLLCYSSQLCKHNHKWEGLRLRCMMVAIIILLGISETAGCKPTKTNSLLYRSSVIQVWRSYFWRTFFMLIFNNSSIFNISYILELIMFLTYWWAIILITGTTTLLNCPTAFMHFMSFIYQTHGFGNPYLCHKCLILLPQLTCVWHC